MEKVFLRNAGVPGSESLDVYEGRGGYAVLRFALTIPPDEIISMVKESELRGRGGAGFPAAMKWKFLPRGSGQTIYLICNADEGEPGTFKDRHIMEFDPHLLIEGMAITAHAIGSRCGYIYIRGEYDWIAKIMLKAIEEALAKGYLGDNIMDSGFSFSIEVFRGAGSYVCGEETALIESLEGRPGRPRLKPPFPAQYGLYGSPTLIHNVSTLSCIPYIIKNGPGAFRALGRTRRGGTKLFSISGHVNRPGVYEYPMGTNLRELIYDAACGIKGGKQLKAVIPGGISTPVLRAEETDVAMDYDPLLSVGSMLGSGGIMVMDEDTSIPHVTQRIARFFAHESCGQCAPCREGTNMIRHLMDRIVEGKGEPEDIERIVRLCRYIRGSTICAFGYAVSLPIAAMIKKFREEFEALVRR
ncbi:MAG: NADH-quinone oxidoreductase subunit NuoF [Nitrospirota bacterium]|nr:NADH-quinone oxidoreductase subunit NuoF [Nitrospirota bacterium]